MQYGKSILLNVTGKFACFSRPGYVERVSALIPSHTGWNGVFNQILGHKGMEYRIDKVWINFMPRHMNVVINEISNFSTKINYDDKRTLRNSSILHDVDYTVECRIISDTFENVKKYENMFDSRIRNHKFWRQPYLGLREYIANIKYASNNDKRPIDFSSDLGISFFGTDYKENKNYFYPMLINNGVAIYPTWDEVKAKNIVLNF